MLFNRLNLAFLVVTGISSYSGAVCEKQVEACQAHCTKAGNGECADGIVELTTCLRDQTENGGIQAVIAAIESNQQIKKDCNAFDAVVKEVENLHTNKCSDLPCDDADKGLREKNSQWVMHNCLHNQGRSVKKLLVAEARKQKTLQKLKPSSAQAKLVQTLETKIAKIEKIDPLLSQAHSCERLQKVMGLLEKL